ncbi:MAG: hypothetical protein J0M16_06160 [Gammaproteobacteria bacterium]|nr:hypothetical protein [Gammaproteobacteria bacterium]
MTRQPSSLLAIAVLALSSLALSSLASPARAACEYPSQVKLPDGASATEADMAAAATAVKKYVADIEAYANCLDAEFAALPAEQQTPEAKDLVTKRFNAAEEAKVAAATAFNEQLRAFKAKK